VDRIIVQTRWQQERIKAGFGVDSVVIPMPCQGPPPGQHGTPPTSDGPNRVLWVGRFCEQKRLEWLLDLAPRCPDLVFDVVGSANADSPYARDLETRASQIPNVVLHGRVPYGEMGRFYQRATLLCSTSAWEGFPNTFLEAWSRGLPVVSTFDPDHRIAQQGLGRTADSVDTLIAGLREMTSSADAWSTASENAEVFFAENHVIETSMPRFERVFREVAGEYSARHTANRHGKDQS
jgi:glycosyltransferase involved in cell wall biosynthesis